MKEYLEQRIAQMKSFLESKKNFTEIGKLTISYAIEELTAALNHLNNIKEE